MWESNLISSGFCQVLSIDCAYRTPSIFARIYVSPNIFMLRASHLHKNNSRYWHCRRKSKSTDLELQRKKKSRKSFDNKIKLCWEKRKKKERTQISNIAYQWYILHNFNRLPAYDRYHLNVQLNSIDDDSHLVSIEIQGKANGFVVSLLHIHFALLWYMYMEFSMSCRMSLWIFTFLFFCTHVVFFFLWRSS